MIIKVEAVMFEAIAGPSYAAHSWSMKHVEKHEVAAKLDLV
jgi:hypothetical protein